MVGWEVSSRTAREIALGLCMHRFCDLSQRSNQPQGPDPRLMQAVGHPLFVGALTLLLLNDHIFKAVWPGTFWTGKLSDVAWLVVAPVLLGALLGKLRVARARSIALGGVGLTFIVLQLWAPLGEAWVAVMGGTHVADAGDLIALPALFLAQRCWQTSSPVLHQWGRRIVIGTGVVALMATSRYTPPDGRSPCVEADDWDPNRPLAIHWGSPSQPVPQQERLLAAGVSLVDEAGGSVPFSVRVQGATVLICPDTPLEPNTTYEWTIGPWPDLGAYTREVPYFYLGGRERFTTASVGTWTDGCTGGREMAFAEVGSCVYDSGGY